MKKPSFSHISFILFVSTASEKLEREKKNEVARETSPFAAKIGQSRPKYVLSPRAQ
jgi:hypothetical protein